jgi:hypothetical protein
MVANVNDYSRTFGIVNDLFWESSIAFFFADLISMNPFADSTYSSLNTSSVSRNTTAPAKASQKLNVFLNLESTQNVKKEGLETPKRRNGPVKRHRGSSQRIFSG